MKDLFSFPLFVQGIKRIRVLSIAFALVAFVFNVLEELSSGVVVENVGGVAVLEVPGDNLLVNGHFFILFPVFLTYSMFSYLNKRSGSDFYHALPQKRKTVFVSFMSAVMAVSLSIMTLCVALYAIVLTLDRGVSVGIGLVPGNLAYYTVQILFVSACTVFPMMFTGTAFFAGCAVAATILIPWWLMSAFEASLQQVYPYYIKEHTFLNVINCELHPLEGLFRGDVRLGYALLFYLVFGVLLIVAACIAYTKRKSETATHACAGGISRIVLRCAPSALCVVVGVMNTFYSPADGEWRTFILVMGLAAVIVSELLISKSIKMALKAARWFMAVLVVGAIFAGAVILTGYVMESHDPDSAEQVESVTLTNGYVFGYDMSLDGPMEPISDRAVINWVLASLKETSDDSYYSGYRIKLSLTDGTVLWRNVHLAYDQDDLLEEYVRARPHLNKQILPLPAQIRFSSEAEKELWQTYEREYYALGFDERKTLNELDYDGKVWTEIKVYAQVGGSEDKYEWFTFYTHYKYTPKAFDMVTKLSQEKEAD